MYLPKPLIRSITVVLTYCMVYGPLAQVAVANEAAKNKNVPVEKPECRSEPVSTQTGNRWLDEKDILLPAPGIPMDFVRRYNSQETEYDGSLGIGWAHNLDWRLFESVEQVEEIIPPGGLENPVQMVVGIGQNLSINHSSSMNLVLVPSFFTGAVTMFRRFDQPVENMYDMYIESGTQRTYMDISSEYDLNLPTLGDRADSIVTAINDTNGVALPIVGYNYDADQYSIGDPVPGREDGMTFGGIEQRIHAYLYVRSEDATRLRFQLQSDGVYRSEENNWFVRVESGNYILTIPGGYERVFNDHGLMTEIRDIWGNTVQLSYDQNGLLESATHSNGLQFSLTHTDGKLTRLDVSTNLYLTFTYNQNGQMATTTRHVDGQSRTFSYEYTNGFLTKKTNPLGHEFNYTYHDGVTGQTWQGRTMEIDPGSVFVDDMEYSGDTIRRLSYPMQSRGVTPVYEYGFSSKRYQLETELGPGVDLTDARTRGLEYQYLDMDRTRIRQFDTGISESFFTFIEYDQQHNITKTEVAYVDANNTTTNRSLVHETVYDQYNNLPIRVTDAAGHKTETDYTNAKPSVVRAFYSDTGSYKQYFSYTTNGLLSATQDANSNVTHYAYDSHGYPASVMPPSGPSTRSVYSDSGFPMESEILPEGSTNGTGRVTTYDRNAEGRLEAVHYADGTGLTNHCNALDYLLRTTDRAGRHIDNTYGPTRKLTSVSKYLDAPGGSNMPVRISYDFDEQFNALRITEPRGRYVESYQLDIQNRPIAVTNINGQVMTTEYGVGDFAKRVVRFDGSTISNAYDNAGRKVFEVFSDGQYSITNSTSYTTNSLVSGVSDGSMNIAYGHDRLNRLTNVVQSGTGVLPVQTKYAYDPVGNRTNAVFSVDSGSAIFERDFEYDAANRLTGFTNHSSTHQSSTAFAFSYNPTNGLAHSVTNVDTGIGAEYAYDVMDRRTEIKWVDAATNTLRSFEMAYATGSGMITNVTEETGEYRVYGYDSIDRLISERHFDSTNGLTFSAAYEYDLAGNRTQTVINGVTNTYALGVGDRLASWGTNAENTVSYDSAGSVTQIALSGKPALNLAWGLQYRLTSASTNGVTVESYQYDATGRRIATTSGTNVVRHIYDGMHVIADTDADGNVLKSYVWGPGIDNLLSMTVYGETATNTYQAIADHIGTVREMVDESGNTVERYEYDAWGNVLGIFDGSGTPINYQQSTINNRFLFQGREYSFVTGLYNFRARWYDPLTGRWLSNDPIGIGGGLNQYAALHNNPVNFVDPVGHFDIFVILAVTLVVVLVVSAVSAVKNIYKRTKDFVENNNDGDLQKMGPELLDTVLENNVDLPNIAAPDAISGGIQSGFMKRANDAARRKKKQPADDGFRSLDDYMEDDGHE